MRLWAYHAGLPAETMHDPLSALMYFRHPRVQGSVEQYDDNAYCYEYLTAAPAWVRAGIANAVFTTWLFDPEFHPPAPAEDAPPPYIQRQFDDPVDPLDRIP